MTMTRRDNLLVKVVTGTTSATPGTRTDHAHGLLIPTPALADIWVKANGVDGDVDDAAAINVVSVDSDSFAVKSNKASVTFVAWIWRNVDDVGRP